VENRLRLVADSLGPVRHLDLELGDLTYFLGPPNIGKSLALKALYSRLIALDRDVMERLASEVASKIISKKVVSVFNSRVNALMKVFVLTRGLLDYLCHRFELEGLDSATLEMLASVLDDVVKEYSPDVFDHVELRLDGNVIAICVKPIPLCEISVENTRRVFLRTYDNFVGFFMPSLNGGVRFYPQDVIAVLENDGFMKSMVDGITSEVRDRVRLARLTVGLTRFLDKVFQDVMSDMLFKIGKENCYSMKLRGKVFFDEENTFHIRFVSKFVVGRNARSSNRIYESNIVEALKDYSLGIIKHLEVIRYKIDSRLLTLGVDFNYILTKTRGIISNALLKEVSEALEYLNGISNVKFIPFGRSLLMQCLNFVQEHPLSYIIDALRSGANILAYSFLTGVIKGRSIFRKIQDSEWIEILRPVMEGRIEVLEDMRVLYRDWRGIEIPMEYASALAGEIAGIFLTYLSLREEPSLLLIEEPEAQLHPSAQVLMGFLLPLFASKGARIVATTHSDILSIASAYLAYFKPSADEIAELISELAPHMNDYVGEFSKAVAEAARQVDVRFYFFDRSGEVREEGIEDVMMAVPGISREVVDKLVSWAALMAVRRRR